MPHVLVVVFIAGLSLVVPRGATAQTPARPGTGSGTGSGSGPAAQTTQAPTTAAEARARERDEMERLGPKFVRTLTNVQIELTITDQTGTEKPEKKTVLMVVSSGSWGKIRSAGAVHRPANVPAVVDLNVDARPFVSVEGLIQLELTIAYSPLGSPGADYGREKPPTVNQSLTVVLQSGKPMVISQAADHRKTTEAVTGW